VKFHKRKERYEIPKSSAKAQHMDPFSFGTEDPSESGEEIRANSAREPILKENNPGVMGRTPLKKVFGPNKDQVQGTQEAQTDTTSHANQCRTSSLPEGMSKQSK
jgi:hypothetical protein